MFRSAQSLAPHAGEDAVESLEICGDAFVAHCTGALFWPSQEIIIVSDLHFEKATAACVRGQFLPPYDTRETLARLGTAIAAFAPKTVICLGDSFHDRQGMARMSEDDLGILRALQRNRSWVWVVGNHDPEIDARAGGDVAEQIEIGGISLRHEPEGCVDAREIAGHLHPAAKLSVYGARVRRRCFVGNDRRIVMPAFGAMTGGLNILDDAFGGLFPKRRFAVWMLGDQSLYRVPRRSLRPD